MTQPHLLPEDVEFLLDGDQGFGSHPLRKHVDSCDDCRGKLDRARAVNELLERLPHAAPNPDFASRVMSRVQVFEPWHVTLVESVRRSVPQAGPWRVLAGVGAGGAAISISALAVWVAFRADLAVYAAQMGWTKLQTSAASAAGTAVSSVFGDAALNAVQTGGTSALLIGITALLATLAGATIGLRRLFATARRQEN